MDGAKYRLIIEDSLLHSAKHLKLVQQFMLCTNYDLKHVVRSILGWL